MPRKVEEFPATEGRDAGKVFVITEMPAMQAEKWAMRALLLVAQSGVDVGQISGMAGVAYAGLGAINRIRFEDAEPLLDEMMKCVSIRPAPQDRDPAKASITRPLFDGDIEEVKTIIRLRERIIDLHLGFSLADYLLKLQQESALTSNLPNTETSPQPSGR